MPSNEGEHAPDRVTKPEPARKTAPEETIQQQSIRLPGRLTNDPRWIRIWSKLLLPIETEGTKKNAR